MSGLIKLEVENDVQTLVAMSAEWKEDDPRIVAATALMYAAERAGMSLFYNLGREELLLQAGEHTTNLSAESMNAILNAALAIELVARQRSDEGKTPEEPLRVRLARLTERAINIGNTLLKWDGEGEAVYERRQSPKGLYLVSNAFNPRWQKRCPSDLAHHAYQCCPRPFVFELPDDIDTLERFIIRDEGLYTAWYEENR